MALTRKTFFRFVLLGMVICTLFTLIRVERMSMNREHPLIRAFFKSPDIAPYTPERHIIIQEALWKSGGVKDTAKFIGQQSDSKSRKSKKTYTKENKEGINTDIKGDPGVASLISKLLKNFGGKSMDNAYSPEKGPLNGDGYKSERRQTEESQNVAASLEKDNIAGAVTETRDGLQISTAALQRKLRIIGEDVGHSEQNQAPFTPNKQSSNKTVLFRTKQEMNVTNDAKSAVQKQDYAELRKGIDLNTQGDRQKSNSLTPSCNKVPDVLIIAFEKCGTATLKRYLNIHPDIFDANEKNDRFFNPETNVTFEKFMENMQCIPKGKIKLEKMAVAGLPKRVYKLNPAMKLLAIVREPVNRAVSHFVHRVSLGYEKEGTFERVIEGILDKNYPNPPENSTLFSHGMYNMKLQPWLNYFNRSSIHIVDGDKFTEQPSRELSKVERFLGLRPYITSDNFVYSPDKGFYCIRNEIEAECMGKKKGRPHPNVDPATIKRLKEFFWQRNEDFFDLFGKRYSWNDNI